MSITFAVVAAVAEGLLLAAAGVLVWRQRLRITAVTHMAGRDELTGLAGRRGLYEAHRALVAAGTPPGVLLLDLALFKDVNDGFGHDVGDDLLRAVASRLAAVAAGVGGVAGRLGGDEFVLLLPDGHSPERLVGVAELVRQALAEPVHLTAVEQRLSVSGVVGLALPDALPVPGRPFRAADIALYHARHHRQPYALYQAGMTHPAAADRHGSRLRDQHPAPPIVVFDTVLFDRLAAGQVSNDVALVDELTDLQNLLDVLDPSGWDFGTDIVDLVAHCVDHRVLRYRHPVTAISIQPTTLGESRDGGFLVLVDVADAVTLASAQVHPRGFRDDPERAALLVLAAIAETACRVYDAYRATRAAVPWGPQ